MDRSGPLQYPIGKRWGILTLLHLAALELLNAVKLVTSSLPKSNHVVTFIAVRPAFLVERDSHVLVVTLAPVVGVPWRLTALTLLKIVQPFSICLVDSLHVSATWTQSPDVGSVRNRKVRLQTEEDTKLRSVCDEWAFQRGLLIQGIRDSQKNLALLDI